MKEVGFKLFASSTENAKSSSFIMLKTWTFKMFLTRPEYIDHTISKNTTGSKQKTINWILLTKSNKIADGNKFTSNPNISTSLSCASLRWPVPHGITLANGNITSIGRLTIVRFTKYTYICETYHLTQLLLFYSSSNAWINQSTIHD